jgi:curli biogenesis system outer membrane secretion channel CsgG
MTATARTWLPVLTVMMSAALCACSEQQTRTQADDEQPAASTAAPQHTHVVKMDGVFYCESKQALEDAWAEMNATSEWLAQRGCGMLQKGEQVSIEARDGAMIRLNGQRWTSALAVEPR